MSLRHLLLSTVAGVSLAALGALASFAQTSAPAPTAPAQGGGAVAPAAGGGDAQAKVATATPITHLVILFNENVSFDHYFATYPMATNAKGEPKFTALPRTPKVNNLVAAHLLKNNPNFTNKANGSDAAEPFRLDRSQAVTADQNHNYTPEQLASDGGKMDLFPKYTGAGTPNGVGAFGTKGLVMGYYDGNTVTGMWEYAQHFAMSDSAFTDAYGPSTPGALELIAGQTDGVKLVTTSKKPSTLAAASYYIDDGQSGTTLIGDVDPAGDVCSVPKDQVLMTGKNIGDLLNTAKVSWGSFMGGFDLKNETVQDTTGCQYISHTPIGAKAVADYIPHHNWFEYYSSTANPTHARPSSTDAIGYSFEHDGTTRDPANHEYDLNDFYAAVRAGNFPAVSYIKLPAYQDGHAGYSDPLDEQAGTVKLINFLEQQPGWKNTAVVITWDDSDGWYDHAYATPGRPSFDAQADQLNGPGKCGTGTPLAGIDGKPVNGRCGPGTRIPFLVISPWARANFVSHQQISLASVVRFIEDNWLDGQRIGGGSFDATAGSIVPMFDFGAAGGKTPVLYLDETNGTPLKSPPKNG
jgi:phospholipase C